MFYQRRFHYFLDTVHSLCNGRVMLPRWTQGIGLRLVLVCALMGVSLGYIVQISRTAVSGYEIHSLGKEIDVLSRDTKELTAEVAELSSLSSINERLSDIHMVKTGKINYVSVHDNDTIAQR